MRPFAALLLFALAAEALPPLSPGFLRMKELRRAIDASVEELRKEEAFASRPREERMLLTFRKGQPFEGKKLAARDVVEACFAWGEADRAAPTESATRVLALLPVVLQERCGGPLQADRKERRLASVPLLKALDAAEQPVRATAIAALRALYEPPRVDKYDPAHSSRERYSAVRAWKRAVWQQNR
jgi:hypothetical protein